MKIALYHPIVTYSLRPDSHRTAWTKIQRCQLANARPRDTFYVESGATAPGADVAVWSLSMNDRPGVWNLTSGVTPKIVSGIEHAVERMREGSLRVLGGGMPDLGDLVSKRWADGLEQFDPIELTELCGTVREIGEAELVRYPQGLVTGDSHCLAVWRGGRAIRRADGLTLHGALTRGLATLVPPRMPLKTIDRLTISLGNIDIRHHLCRQPDPIAAAEALAREYVDTVATEFGCPVQLVEPYPIEHEGRLLPKSGWYKGTPFFGDWETRNDIRIMFTSALREAAAVSRFEISTWRWPDSWYDLDPSEYAAEMMEKPRSVHLSPRHYAWDLDENRIRTR